MYKLNFNKYLLEVSIELSLTVNKYLLNKNDS